MGSVPPQGGGLWEGFLGPGSTAQSKHHVCPGPCREAQGGHKATLQELTPSLRMPPELGGPHWPPHVARLGDPLGSV